MINKVLTIGIPTFNGSKYIREAIDSVISQVDNKYCNLLEILVSDNASTDDTGIIIDDYVNKSKITVTYVCNDVNVGYDRNVDNLFKHAEGEFVWILGDDDYLADGAITKFFEVITKYNDLAVILLSVQFLDIVTGNRNRMVVFDKDVLCEDGNTFFQKSKWGAAAVSSLVIRKDSWNLQELTKYFNTQWIHIGAIINILKNKSTSYIISDIMVIVRVSNSRWEGHFGNRLDVSFKCLNILRETLALGYDKATFEYYLKDKYKSNVNEIFMLRPNIFKDKITIAQSSINAFKFYPFFWLIHLPLLFLPRILFLPLKLIWFKYQKFKANVKQLITHSTCNTNN